MGDAIDSSKIMRDLKTENKIMNQAVKQIFKKQYIYIEPIEKSFITKDINKDFENIN